MGNQRVFGTEHLPHESFKQLLSAALSNGFGEYDTALTYPNFHEVAKFFKKTNTRVDIHLKIRWLDFVELGARDCIERALRSSGQDYIHCAYLHAPKGADHLSAMEALRACRDASLVRQVGLSNFTLNHLRCLQKFNALPDTLQVEIHPYLQEAALVEFCHHHGILIVAHTALAKGRIFRDKALMTAADNNAAQLFKLVFEWHRLRSCKPILQTSSIPHTEAAAQHTMPELPEQFLKHINASDIGERICNHNSWGEFQAPITDVLSAILKFHPELRPPTTPPYVEAGK